MDVDEDEDGNKKLNVWNFFLFSRIPSNFDNVRFINGDLEITESEIRKRYIIPEMINVRTITLITYNLQERPRNIQNYKIVH